MEFFLFYLFSSVLIYSGLCVILVANPVNGVFYLILAFCNATGILLLCEVEFLAIIFLIVYVGAIAVLFLFVIIILNLKENFYAGNLQRNVNFYKYIPIGAFLGAAFLVEIYSVLTQDLVSFKINSFFMEPSYTEWVLFFDSLQNLEIFGQVLYSFYLYFFLLAGFVLIVSIIGAITLTSQKNIQSTGRLNRKQHVFQQISRNTESAVFLVKRKNT